VRPNRLTGLIEMNGNELVLVMVEEGVENDNLWRGVEGAAGMTRDSTGGA